MPATVTSIAPAREGDPADPREALREAHARLAAAKAALDARRVDLSRTERLVEDQEAKLLAAKDAVTAEKDAQAEAIASGKTPSPDKVRQARDAERDVEDRLDAVHAAVAKIEADLPDFIDDVARAELHVITCRNSAIAPVIMEMLERARKAKADWLLLPQILKVLAADDPRLPELKQNLTESLRLRERVREPLFGIQRDVHELLMMNIVLGGPVIDGYERWREKLLTDPDAQMPEAV